MSQIFPTAIIDYCTYFNAKQDYFECHEVGEEYWKEIAPQNKTHSMVGYIQLAVSLYHYRRGNLVGAKQLLASAKTILKQPQQHTMQSAIMHDKLLLAMERYYTAILQHKDFEPLLLPLTPAMQQAVQLRAKQLPTEDSDFLTHKHTLRDRSDVILERQRQLLLRRGKTVGS